MGLFKALLYVPKWLPLVWILSILGADEATNDVTDGATDEDANDVNRVEAPIELFGTLYIIENAVHFM